MYPKSQSYEIISKLVNFRQKNQLWSKQQIQRYADDNFYAFTRGDDILCLFVNTENFIERVITFHPYKPGDRMCNLFNSKECVKVNKKNELKVTLGGDFKVYVKIARDEDLTE
jgi:hypothetical protein